MHVVSYVSTSPSQSKLLEFGFGCKSPFKNDNVGIACVWADVRCISDHGVRAVATFCLSRVPSPMFRGVFVEEFIELLTACHLRSTRRVAERSTTWRQDERQRLWPSFARYSRAGAYTFLPPSANTV